MARLISLAMSSKATNVATNIITQAVSVLEIPYDDMGDWQKTAARGFVLFCGFFVFSLTPVAFVTLLYLTFSPAPWGIPHAVLALWSLSEVAFYVFYRYCFAIASRHQPPLKLTFDERIALAKKMLEHIDDIFLMLNNWLHLQPTEPLTFKQYSTWIIYAFFDKAEENLTEDEVAQSKEILSFFENQVEFPEASSDKEIVKYVPVRPTIEPLQVIHKPLIFFLVTGIPKMLAHLGLQSFGFTRYAANDNIHYWSNNIKSHELPILFIHGIGLGYSMYFRQVARLTQLYPNRHIILYEVPSVSLSPVAEINTKDQTIQAVDIIFQTHNLETSSVIAHSYGTVIATWLVKFRPHYVTKLSLVDPICFMLWDSTLVYGFLLSRPTSMLHEFIRLFLSRDLVMANTFCRYFMWHASFMFPDEIHCPANIYFSKKDCIIDAKTCYAHLEKHANDKVSLTMFDISHGIYLIDGEILDSILVKV
ncbi:hypothetical protein DSO57_1025627 [Entomophthora muscae]|uniref:Uncharacterized protein n=1 Tax=Entomophthora muscae TaxID=34485 RepID=A0ACC2UCR5_9FUNG|nr:hypothetical protein DSO57_1025627 [Entomophthora muscae]